jgi:hypothetical protein
MAKPADKKATKGGAKGKNAAKGKGKKGKGADPEQSGKPGRPMSVAAHPVARMHVRKAKGLGGLIGFIVAFAFSMKASVPVTTAGERALAAGVAGYLLGWAASVTIWRQLMIAELRLAAEQVIERHRKAREE